MDQSYNSNDLYWYKYLIIIIIFLQDKQIKIKRLAEKRNGNCLIFSRYSFHYRIHQRIYPSSWNYLYETIKQFYEIIIAFLLCIIGNLNTSVN